MRTSFKVLSLLALLLVGLAVIPAVSAVDDFVFDKVEINGDEVDLSNPETVAVERGDSLDLHIKLHLDENATEDVDVRLEAWMGGYEYHSIRAETEEFTLSETGASKTKDLTLELPDDMDAGDYTLYVKVLDHNVMLEIPLSLEVENTRHKLTVQDVIVSPNNPEAGETVFVTVRLENMGDRKEEDIRVEVSALGVSAATYVDELVTEDVNDDETSASSKPLVLKLPEDAQTGDYDLTVTVTYNRGHSVVEEVRTLHVTGTEVAEEEAEEEAAVKAIVSVDTTTQTLAPGKETVYKLTFANMGEEAQLFSANVAGAQLWADARVDPGFVSVQPGLTGELYVYVKAHDDAEEGNHLFTLQLFAGTDLVKELPLGARVAGDEAGNEATGAASAVGGLLSSSTLKLGFVGLVLLVVIIGLVVALRKLKDDDEYPLEPKDGQTYY